MSSMGAPRDAARVRASRDSLSRRLGVGAGFAIVYCKFCNRTIERPPRLLRACRVMAGLVPGIHVVQPLDRFAYCSRPIGVSFAPLASRTTWMAGHRAFGRTLVFDGFARP